jgi:lipid II:glycine glycyltransferase (peptidoglycan interpeptide bridge formation enzyme)
MKSKWRYNARLAAKRGVAVREAGPEGLESFYSLLKVTGRRDGIAIHSPEYYRTLFSHCVHYAQAAETGGRVLSLRCYIASHGGEDIAAVIVLFRDRSAVYLYGASSDRKRNLMAPYALQLRAMEDARAAGCAEYDLFGIPPDADPAHPMAGLYRFKTGFGGRIIHRPGSWDYPYKVLSYRLFTAAEGIRKKVRTLKRNRKRHES